MRKAELDWMKGVGIMLVILAHYTPEYTYNQINAFHMPLFFFVGGYLYKAKPWKDSMKRDLRRLIVPYLWANLAIILFFAVWGFKHGNFGLAYNQLKAVFYSTATTEQPSLFLAHKPALGPLWFLLAMYWCKNVYNMLQCKYQVILGFALGAVASYVHYKLINAPLGLLTGCSAMMFYALGSLAKGNVWFEKPKVLIFALGIAMWYVSFSYYPLASCTCHYPNLLVNVLGALGPIYLLYHAGRNLPCGPLEWLGRNSLTVLCVHAVCYFTRNYFTAKLLGSSGYLFFVDMTASILFVLLTEWVNRRRLGSQNQD